jgi:putative hemolysin
MSVGATILVILCCLISEAFFSGSEIAVISADRMRLRAMAAKGNRGAKLALEMLENPEWLLSTTLVGTNISVVTSSTLTTALMMDLVGHGGELVALATVAPLVWIFGEIVPKSVFQQRADTITPKAIFLLRFFSIVLSPLVALFGGLARLLATLFGAKEQAASSFTLREQVQAMMEMPATVGGDIQPAEQTMIRRLFEFSETTARDVMLPLIDVVVLEEGATVGEAMAMSRNEAHSRIPVYSERVDRIVGLLSVLELLGVDDSLPISDWVAPVDYVPGVKGIQELLVEMRSEGRSVSIVVDEFGGAEGIVTIEDIVEVVVDEIEDEYDDDDTQHEIWKQGERDYIVSARIELETLSEELGLKLPTGRYTTLAGFLLDRARDVPEHGDVIDFEEYSFIIHRAVPQAIIDVRIRW